MDQADGTVVVQTEIRVGLFRHVRAAGIAANLIVGRRNRRDVLRRERSRSGKMFAGRGRATKFFFQTVRGTMSNSGLQ
jgi:hypothetical protein